LQAPHFLFCFIVWLTDVIYPEPLSTLSSRVELIVVSANMAPLLEAQGKASDRTSCQSTLDALRAARRNDMVTILPALHVC
jgi:hypothetical protein